MDYRDALEIARKNSGAFVTRDESDGFIVKRPDGSLIDAPISSEDDVAQLRHENESLEQRYDDKFTLLVEARREHRAEIAGLEEKIHKLQSSLSIERESLQEAAKQIEQLQAKLAKVSPEEWARIKIADKKEQEEYARALKAERHTQNCTCLGEVENCARCDGRGTYVTDGYGNIVSA